MSELRRSVTRVRAVTGWAFTLAAAAAVSASAQAPGAVAPVPARPVAMAAAQRAPSVATPPLAANVPAAPAGPRPRPLPPLPGAAAVRSANAQARSYPTPEAYINSTLFYDYEAGRLYEVQTSPHFLTAIMLRPGEKLLAKASGDTVRWVLGETAQGAGANQQVVVLIKPIRGGLRTNIVLTTDQRTYLIEAASREGGAYTSAVSWNYPQEEMQALAAQQAAAEAAQTARAQVVVAPALAIDQLHFGYRVEARKGKAPRWEPLRVFDDGTKTYIQFPINMAATEAPPLFLVGPGDKAELVNYRYLNGYYIVDRLIDVAELRIGEKPQTVVRITRTGDRGEAMTYLPPDPPMDAVGSSTKLPPESVLAAPRTPVTRWNRRYILAGGAALAAIVAFGFYIGFGGAHRPQPRADANAPAADVTPTTSGLADRYPKGYGDPGVQAAGGPGTVSLPPPGTAVSVVGAPGAQPPARPVDPAVQQAQAQAQAARTASPFFQGGSTAGVAGPSPAPPAPTFVANGPGAPSQAPEAVAADVQPANGQGGKRQFLAGAKADDYLANPLRAPQSQWEVKAGTVIPAALLTAINSDLPGEIIAQVTEPVYDHVTGRTVLIPQGSRLIGQYDSQVAYGQERALIAWTRIVMPDGRSINIGSMEGADLSGASGLKDRVDGHFWQLARGILLSTVFSVGAASAQDASSRSSGSFVLNSAGTGVSAEAQQVGQQITSRDLNRQPTITVRAGWPLRVLVNKDMILAPYP